MSEHDRPVVESTTMFDAHTTPPQNGQKVFALSVGGVMVQIVWNKDSINHFDAWHPYLKVPESVKQRQRDRYKPSTPCNS